MYKNYAEDNNNLQNYDKCNSPIDKLAHRAIRPVDIARWFFLFFEKL